MYVDNELYCIGRGGAIVAEVRDPANRDDYCLSTIGRFRLGMEKG